MQKEVIVLINYRLPNIHDKKNPTYLPLIIDTNITAFKIVFMALTFQTLKYVKNSVWQLIY